ncbi:low-density lipoprotein receptor class A domain-containing protein 1-like [Hyperolius riggenbachi]|uniref:low-density lipoprotein receptor class A domain-containing protein 1-like n=1 Tax=Hyperolius riggenbachi TaxID=752182 RepID=UPI0035A27B1B
MTIVYWSSDCSCCFRRKCFCITVIVLLTLGAISGFITLGVIFGIPQNENEYTRECKTSSGTTGFLCDDRTTCIAASSLCDGQVNCANGEDEAKRYCRNLPNNLPEGLLFRCSNRRMWTYIDRLCDGKNDCGDCSDEQVPRCPPCLGWRCNTVFFADCGCIPKTRCFDNVQDCTDWSDELHCR